METVAPAPAGPFSPGAGSFEFDDFEAAIRNAAPAWSLKYLQIGRGRARFRLNLAQTGQMVVAVVGRSPGFLECGSPPPGAATFSILLQGTRLLGQRLPWELDSMAIVPPGAEYELLATSPSTAFTMAVNQMRLDEESLEMWGRRFPAREIGPCLQFQNPAAKRGLVATWARWLNRARRNPGMLLDPGIAARMEEEILHSLLCGVAPSVRVPPSRPYRELALRVESFIRRSLEEQIKIDDICRATNASARSVHASFQTIFGMPPKAYWKALRLSRARDDLRLARRGTTVSDVASKWSFYRFGYFSTDYRNAFGENPSDTLQRARGRIAAPVPTGSGVLGAAG
jgi:AraC family ethanolamine operon transcriptional activator